MSRKFLYSALTLSLSSLFLTACGGGGGDDGSSSTFVHIYNASPNSTLLAVEYDDNDGDTTNHVISSLSYGSLRKTILEPETYTVEVRGRDSDDEEEDRIKFSHSLTSGQNNLAVIYGDYGNDSASNLKSHTVAINYDISDELDEDKMRLYVGDFTSQNTSIQLCYSPVDDDYKGSETKTLTTTAQNQVKQVGDFDTDESYTFYAIAAADTCGADESDILFTAKNVPLNSEINYLLVLRDSVDAPSNGAFAMDRIVLSTVAGSSDSLTSYEDANGSAQYRLLNTTESAIIAQVNDNNSGDINLASGTSSSFLSTQASEYTLSVNAITDPLSLELEKNRSESIVIYKTLGKKVSRFKPADAYEYDVLRSTPYKAHISLINLAYEDSDIIDKNVADITKSDLDQAEDDVEEINFSLRLKGEDTTVKLDNVDYKGVERRLLLEGTYVLSAKRDNDDALIAQMELVLDAEKNYTIVLYKQQNQLFSHKFLVVGNN